MQTNSKLREACANIAEYARSAMSHTEDAHVLGYLNQIEGWAKAALAEPVRNCEVGTAEEQAERLHAYCKSHRCLYCSSGNGDECKFYRPGMKTDCKIEWANAPYKEGGAK